ncbi:unnamed protein product [Ectocarpus sp. CCAP 1310/34]|nr:unnamed protein product [Ectocarpus sp. CCAP 1310/34]
MYGRQLLGCRVWAVRNAGCATGGGREGRSDRELCLPWVVYLFVPSPMETTTSP